MGRAEMAVLSVCVAEVCLYVGISLCLALSRCVCVWQFLAVSLRVLVVLSFCLSDGSRRDETRAEETGAGRPCCVLVCGSEVQGRVEGSGSVQNGG